MSELRGELPNLSHEYHPTHRELLSEISRRGPEGAFQLGDTGDDGVTLITVTNRAATESSLVVNSDGEVVSSFACKFDPEFNGWQPGELVNGNFNVRINENDEPVFDTAPRISNEGMDGDTFTLTNLSNADRAHLKNIGLAELDADIQITGARKPVTLGISQYPATIREIRSIQEPWDGETPVALNEQLLLEGTVIARDTNAAEPAPLRSQTIAVQLANNRIVSVTSASKQLTFRGSIMEVPYPATPMEGDLIHIRCTMGDNNDLQANPTNSYLLRPSEARQAAYDAMHKDIAQHITKLSETAGSIPKNESVAASFRSHYGEFMQQHTRIQHEGEQAPHIALTLTKDERAAIRTIVERAFPTSADGTIPLEKPFTDTEHLHDVVATADAYGVNAYAMSRGELYAFCRGIASGTITMRPRAEGAPERYGHDPFRLLENAGFTAAEKFSLYKTATEYWTTAVAGKEVTYGDELITDPAVQAAYSDISMAESSLGFLGDIAPELPAAQYYLYDTGRALMHRVLTNKPGIPTADRLLLYRACDAMARNANRSLHWENSRPVAVRDIAHIAFLAAQVPELVSYEEQFLAAGNQNSADAVGTLIDKITRAASIATLSEETDT